MAWNEITWKCGHTGAIQLFGKHSVREYQIAIEKGKVCPICQLIQKWKKENDPRSKREDKFELAKKITEEKSKIIRVYDFDPEKEKRFELEIQEGVEQE